MSDCQVDHDTRSSVLEDQLFVVVVFVVFLTFLFSAWIDSVERRVSKLEAASMEVKQ